MKTRLLSSEQLDIAIELIDQGDLVAVPTETVYGLAADASQESALRKIFEAKGRPVDHPLIVHLSTADDLSLWASSIPEGAYLLAEAFWPGPLTLVLKKRSGVSDLITGGSQTIALRVPDHPLTLSLINKLPSRAVAAPSANFHKKTSPTKPEHVLKTLDGRISAVLDGGACSVGLESTILDLTHDNPAILRPGAITKAQIAQILNKEVVEKHDPSIKMAGNMEIHYQPQTPLFILPFRQLQEIVHKETHAAIVHHTQFDLSEQHELICRKMPKEKTEYAAVLYHTLYELDGLSLNAIYLEKPPLDEQWRDVHDRLTKAQFKNNLTL